MRMEKRCNILTGTSVIYTLFVCIKQDSFASVAGYTFVVLLFQCLFVWLFTHNGNKLQDPAKYRPGVDPNVMCVFLVPICLLHEMMAMDPHTDSAVRYQDVQQSLCVTAVIITKYFFLLGKHKMAAMAVLSVTVGYLLVFSHYSVIMFCLISSFLVWKSLDLLPRVAPRSFSFGEMSICLQLSLSFGGRIAAELGKMNGVQQDELRLKWVGVTAVLAILTATALIRMMKMFVRVVSLLTFVGVYALFAVASLAFLSWTFEDNLIGWFLKLLQHDCTLIMLLFSWIIFCGITLIWTVGHALQSSIVRQETTPSEYSSRLKPEMLNINDNRLEYTRLKRNVTSSDSGDVDHSFHQTKLHHNVNEKATASSHVSFDARKVFHLFILLVYVPGLVVAPPMLMAASCLAFGVFVIVEAARVLQVPGLGPGLDSVLRTFVDDRDQGVLFLTHFYLLVGLSVPLWVTRSSLHDVSLIKLYSGVLSLGIGDTMACLVGKSVGRRRWQGTNKTVEGTLSSILAQLGFIYICTYLDVFPPYSHIGVLFGVTHGALYEAFTDQIDNLVLPLALYPFLTAM